MRSQQVLYLQTMHSDNKHFFKMLGARVAALRNEGGMSQQAVADELGIAQQTYAHYGWDGCGCRCRCCLSFLALRCERG